MTRSAEVARNAVVNYGGRVYTSVLAFVILSLVLPRALAEHDFGVLTFYLTLSMLLASMLDFGAGLVVVREAARARDRAGRLIGILVRIKAWVGLAGAVGLVALALAFDGLSTRALLITIAALHLPFHALTAALVIHHVDMAFERVVAANALGQTAWLVATIALVFAGVAEPGAYVLAFGAGPVVAGFAAWRSARARVDIRFDASRDEVRDLWRAAWPMGVAATMSAAYFHLDTVMLRPLVGEVAVAHYSAAYRLCMFLIMVPQLFSQVVFPLFSRAWPRGPRAFTPVFHATLGFLAGLALVVAATLPLAARDVMLLVYPPAYADAAGCLAILAFALVCVFVSYPYVNVLLTAGETRSFMKITMAGAIGNVALNLWWIPRFGIEGAAWATVLTEAWIVVGAAVTARRRTATTMNWRRLARVSVVAALAAAGLAVLLARASAAPPIARVGVAMAVAAVAVLAAGLLPLRFPTVAVDAEDTPG